MLGDADFNLVEKTNNYEKEISMDIKLNKTCFSIGETIQGTIILTPKPNSTVNKLLNPEAKFIFQEKQNYTLLESYYDKLTDTIKSKKRNINDTTIIGEELINFSNYLNANITPNIKIPFKIKVPKYVCPSCLFGNNVYIIHILSCEFKSLEVKKSVIIIIKNSPFFTKENNYLKIPAIYTEIITKHKFGILNCGYFELKITLEKNICPYDENLPIIIDINCNNLSMIKLKAINIYLLRNIRKKYQKEIKNIIEKKDNDKIEELVRKTLPLKEGEKIYHIKDDFKFPISSNYSNPEEVYTILDKDKREDKLKFFNVTLFPSFDGNLLSCQYYIKILIETNTLFSTNEGMKIPIDFYSPFKEKEEKKIKSKSIHINISKSFKLKRGEKIFGGKINMDMDKLEQKNYLKDDDDIIKKYFDIKKEKFFNMNFDLNEEEEKKEKKPEPKDQIKENKIGENEDDDDNFGGFEILHKYK